MTSPPQRCDGGPTTRKRSASSMSEKSPDGGSTTRATLPSSSATYRQSTLASFFSTPASPRPNSLATSNVSVPTFVNATPALSSSATPPVASTSTAKVLRPFWNASAQALSANLSLPTKTDLLALEWSSWSGYAASMRQCSWFSATLKCPPTRTNYETTYSPSQLLRGTQQRTTLGGEPQATQSAR